MIRFESSLSARITAEVYNKLGQQVFHKEIVSFSGKFEQEINLEGYEEGVYIVKVTGESNIFLIQETSDEKYELIFGDGIFGKKLQSGNVIRATYIKTNDGTIPATL